MSNAHEHLAVMKTIHARGRGGVQSLLYATKGVGNTVDVFRVC